MTSRIFWNIHAQGVSDTNYLLETARDLQPAWALVMNGLGLAQQIKEAAPGCNVIHRVHPDEENELKVAEAKTWVAQKQAEIGSADVWCYTFNEVGFSDDYLKLTTQIIREATKVGLKVVVGNMSVGTPQPEDWHKPAARELLEALNAHRETAVLGIHEYGCAVATSGFYGGYPDNAGVQPGTPGGTNLIPQAAWPTAPYPCYHLGRFKFLLDACTAMEIPAPRIVLTEHGFDDVSDIKPWTETLVKTAPYETIRAWKSCKDQWAVWYPQWSHEQAYFEQLVYADETLYQGTPVEAQLIFCWGITADRKWESFDVSGAYELYRLLEEHISSNPPDTGDGGGEELPPVTIDMWKMMHGSGGSQVRAVSGTNGSIEHFQEIKDPNDSRAWILAKNIHSEQMALRTVNGVEWICRSGDDSMGNGFQYRQHNPDGSDWPMWIPRYVKLNVDYERRVRIKVHRMADCHLLNDYQETSYIRVVAFHKTFTVPHSNIVLQNVVEATYNLAGNRAVEGYMWAEGIGLILWQNYDTGVMSFLSNLNASPPPEPAAFVCGGRPEIPANTGTPPMPTYPPKPNNASDPVTVVIEGVDAWIVRERPDRDSKQVGTFRVGDQVVFYRNPEESADGYLWHYGECAATGVKGYCAYVLPAPVEPPEPEPEPEPIKITMLAEFTLPGGTDVEVFMAAMESITGMKFTAPAERVG